MPTNSLFDSDTLYAATPLGAKANSPVRCLGKDFKNDDERRTWFREELRKQLPELKKLEGFPIGEDDDIIELSDPPYYTACPNPWLNDFVAEWEQDKQALQAQKKRKADFEVHEPYASDVSEGKNNPIYNAHSYHTKVPHPAIMRYILHYTQPGDIVLDGFAGTGMTGVAAQLCGNPDHELKFKIEQEFTANGLTKPVWGARKAICGDLSPIASFIAYNYNTPVDVAAFEKEAKRILAEVEKECGWMYETWHYPNKELAQSHGATENTSSSSSLSASSASLREISSRIKGRINYTVWSEVLSCPTCAGSIVFTDSAMDDDTKKIADILTCPHCDSQAKKSQMVVQFETFIDSSTGQPDRRPKRVPVLINYKVGKVVHTKKPDEEDIELIAKITSLAIPKSLPMERFPDMQMTRVGRMRTTNSVAVHHMFLPRPSQVMGLLWEKAKLVANTRTRNMLLFMFEQAVWTLSILNRFRPTGFSQVNQFMSGVYYVASQTSECSPWYVLNGKLNRLGKAFREFRVRPNDSAVNTGTATCLPITDASIDYIFTDPPFGENIYYSDLNFLIESWHGIKTESSPEAIVDRVRMKGLPEYHQLMSKCFSEFFRILKPGRWMTVEFSNTGAAVWNGIQTSLQRAGFVIANVAALDKQQGSFMAVTTPTAVKQDLVISCYKPSSEFDQKFRTQSGDINVWAFIDEHLAHLPVSIIKNQKTTAIIERSPKILYDRMLSFFLMRNLPIPLDAAEFQQKLVQHYRTCDGMIFTNEQLASYEDQKRKLGISDQMSFVFDAIYSESEAIAWLKEKLEKTPTKRQDLYTGFMKANASTRKGEKELELSVLLDENFIEDSVGRWRVPDPNEAKDREALRTKALLKEFNQYLEALGSGKVKKIKDVRLEALRVGFRYCWEKKEWATIVNLGDKVPQNLLMEDEQLLMYYDIAQDRM